MTGPTTRSTEPAEAAIALVQRQLDAYNAQDLDAFAATYADEIQIQIASSGQTIVRGKAALRVRYGEIFRKFPANRARIAERRTEGNGVVLDHEIITGRGPDKPDPWDVGFVRYEVADGLIQRVVLP
jgi:hypothetical protein